MFDWKMILTRLVAQPLLHARFINTISLMEYMGARKIMKSQREELVSAEILAHMNEEIRHAQVFKKIALKMSHGEFKTYREDHLLAGLQGRNYIQTVDQAIASALKGENSYLNYLLSTLLIEERANSIYPFYAELMEPLGFSSPIRNILKEEENHLLEIQKHLLDSKHLNLAQMGALRMIEEEAFMAIMSEVEFQLDQAPSAHFVTEH